MLEWLRPSSRRFAFTARVLALGMAFDAAVAVRPVAAAPADVFEIAAPVIGAEPPKAAEIHEGDASVSTQTGAAQYSYPIEVPPGRQGVQPHLALSYSSQAPLYGGLAAGWSLSIPSITMDTSHGRLVDATNNGVNRVYVSTMAGGRQLIPVTEPVPSGYTAYRAQNDSTFTRYQRTAEGTQPSAGYSWIAYGSDGTTYYFGDVNHAAGCSYLMSDENAPLTRTVDAFGNTVDYWYQPGSENECRIASITWGENPNANIGAFAAIEFGYSSAPPSCAGVPVGSQSSYRTGTNIVTGASELDTLDISAFPAVAYSATGYTVPSQRDHTRTITLGYDASTATGMSGQVSCFRQLDSIGESASGTNSPGVTLPPITFSYGSPVLTYPTEGSATYSPWESASDPNPNNIAWGYRNLPTQNDVQGVFGGGWPTVESMMLDVDGDGRADRVTIAQPGLNGVSQDDSRYVYPDGPRGVCVALWYRNCSGESGCPSSGFTNSAKSIDLPTLKWANGTGPSPTDLMDPERCALNYQFTTYKNAWSGSTTSTINYECTDTCASQQAATWCPSSGTCGDGQDCFGLPMHDTTLAYRWLDIDNDGVTRQEYVPIRESLFA